MKRSFTKPVKVFSAAVLLSLMVLLAASAKTHAQVSTNDIMGTTNVTLSSNAVANMLENIKSENTGLRRSAIYYAGYYRVKEALGTLVDQLKKEKDPSTRILISLSLYKLDDESAMGTVKYFAENDPSVKVKRMCSALYTEYLSAHNRIAVK